jgi:hypothetical protein
LKNIIDVNYVILLSIILFVAMIIILLKVNIKKTSEDTLASVKYKKIVGIFLAIIGGLPIIIYPIVLLANIMSLAAFVGTWTIDDLLPGILMLGLIIITTVYPIIYVICIYSFFRKSRMKNLIIPAIPICIVLFIIAYFAGISYHENLYDNNGNYKIQNAKIFKDTPAWNLALSVKNEDVNSIEEILKANPELINFQDDNYGATPLLWAVGVRKYKSVEALLKCGADPNIPAKGELGTPLLVAVMKPWDDKYVDNSNIIELLLKYKADPNKGYIGEDTLMMESGTSPLHRAAYVCIEKTKALVEGGADINIKTKSGRTPAINALIDGSFYKKEAKSAIVAYYLIVQKKAKVSEPYFSRDENINESERKEYFPVDILRDWVSDLDSEEYLLKMEVVNEFLQQGVNYWDTEISDKRLKSIMKLYPNDWQEFIKQY